MKKRLLSLGLALSMVLSMLPATALAAEVDGETEIAVTSGYVTPDELQAAIEAAQEGDTIYLGTGEYSTTGTNYAKGKTLVFEGQGEETVWKLGQDVMTGDEHGADYSLEDANVTFKNMTISDRVKNADYRGFVRAASLTFENCTFDFRGAYWGSGAVTFKNCTFQDTGNWTMWCYSGTDFTFEGCTFETSTKGVLNLYQSATNQTVTVTLKDCIFNGPEKAIDKPVVQIGEDHGDTNTFLVTFTNCTINGNYAAGTDGNQYFLNKNNKSDAHLQVTIDGVKYTANGEEIVPVAQIGDKQYATLAEAFAAAKKGDTITLLGDVTVTEQIKVADNSVLSDITLDGQDHTITASGLNAANQSVLYFGDASTSCWATGVKIQDLTITTGEGEARFGIALMGGTMSQLTNVTVAGNYVYGVNLYGTHGAVMTDCDLVSVFTNGQSQNPLELVNTQIGTLVANKSDSAVSGAKVFIDEKSYVDTLKAAGSTQMIDPASLARVGKLINSSSDAAMAAEVNGVYYGTLAEAFAAVEANGTRGQTLKLLSDVVLTEQITITNVNVLNKFLLDGNNKTITAMDLGESQSVLRFGKGAAEACEVDIQDLTIVVPEGEQAMIGIWLAGGHPVDGEYPGIALSKIDNVTVQGDFAHSGIYFGGTHGGTLTNCDVVSAFTNGKNDVPLKLVNTQIGTLMANKTGEATQKVKVFIDESSYVKVLEAYGSTQMMDPAGLARVGTLLNGNNGKPMAAEVNGVYYGTLADAVSAAEDGDTITLLGDVTVTSHLWLNKSITLDLGAHTLSGPSSWLLCIAADVTVTNGTVGAPGAIHGVYGGATLTVAEDATLYGIVYMGADYSSNASSCTLNVYGTLRNTDNQTVYVNGLCKTWPTVNLYDGAQILVEDSNYSEKSTSTGMYLAGPAVTNIYGGKVQGVASGISIKAGTLNLYGGEVKATGAPCTPENYGNGINASGAAIQIESNTGYAGDILVNIAGGAVVSEQGYAIYEYGMENGTQLKGIAISGGTISGGIVTSDAAKEIVTTGYSIAFDVTPADATVVVKCEDQVVEANENGVYSMDAEKEYTYTVSKSGYVTKTGTVSAPTAEGQYTVTVTVALEKKASSAGGSTGGSTSSSTSTSNKNPDGSTTTTTTDQATGTVTTTTTTAIGVTGTTVTNAEGAVTEIVVTLPASAAASGTVTLPVQVEAAGSAETAPVLTVSVPQSSGAVQVVVPVTEVNPGVVAVLVKADGTEEIMKGSVANENGVLVTVEGATELKLVDNTPNFDDVAREQWYDSAVTFVAAREIMTGTGADTFAPQENLTRGMIAQVLYSLHGKPEADTNVFDDVDSGDWYADAVSWAAENGLVAGTGAGIFAPEDNITREQMAVILHGYAKLVGVDTTTANSLDRFHDGDSASSWAQGALEWALSAGLLSGKDGGMLDPTGTATRAEVAQILANFCKLMAG